MPNDFERATDDRFFSRVLGTGFGVLIACLIWQSCFRPDDREACELYCRQQGKEFKGGMEQKGNTLSCECGFAVDKDRLHLP